ncbi:hypothetical protein WKH82_17430 [Acinetobacter baumannii]
MFVLKRKKIKQLQFRTLEVFATNWKFEVTVDDRPDKIILDFDEAKSHVVATNTQGYYKREVEFVGQGAKQALYHILKSYKDNKPIGVLTVNCN